MRTETETRWMVLGADGRHVSLGRAEPSQAEVMAASDALATQGLSGWLARIQGDYYSRGKVTLEPLQRIGIAHDADWQAALTAFQTARRRSISTGTQQRGPHFGNYSRICHVNHMA
jgi:hypothetical protein